ncbi:hypothetical protein STANM309S_00628 [Streptomyces tanashiensis]
MVCSPLDDPELWHLGVRSTTNPVQLALWHSTGPVTIYATYASLGVLVEAFEGAYGQKLAPVDLAVVDEAHRTSGSMGKAWADIHDQTKIPAHRRLYLTATPRIWEERLNREVAEGVRDPLPREMAASMDDEKVFGPVLYKLSLASAVSRKLLARYQIIVLELQDPVVTPERLMGEERHSEEVRGQRLGALQAALLHTMEQHNLQTCITFHHRTIEAAAYAEGLECVAKRLHVDQPERYPAEIWADWLCGEHVPERRREVLGKFGSTARRAVLSNCRVLGEGVDIRAVDSVALLDPKGAPHDIVQAIGRALRQKPGEGKSCAGTAAETSPSAVRAATWARTWSATWPTAASWSSSARNTHRTGARPRRTCRGSSAPPVSSTAQTSPCSSPPATRSRGPHSAWRCARTSWPCTATCWAPGSKALSWRA